jgi:hypothetical protein
MEGRPRVFRIARLDESKATLKGRDDAIPEIRPLGTRHPDEGQQIVLDRHRQILSHLKS